MAQIVKTDPPDVIVNSVGFTMCGTGGEARSWLNPEMIRKARSFVIHDPDGSLLKQYGLTFTRNAYVVKRLNLTDIRLSTQYNPFMYIRDDKGVMALTDAFINGTNGELSDDRSVWLETLLLDALISFIYNEAPIDELNLKTLIVLLKHMTRDYAGNSRVNAVDILFEQALKRRQKDAAVSKYRYFKESAGAEEWRITKSCYKRFAPLDTMSINHFMSCDEIRLDCMSFPRTALFVIDGDADKALGFLSPLMYTQLFDLYCEKPIE